MAKVRHRHQVVYIRNLKLLIMAMTVLSAFYAFSQAYSYSVLLGAVGVISYYVVENRDLKLIRYMSYV